jgi:aspartyl/asparaginyl-tRNA synthetase
VGDFVQITGKIVQNEKAQNGLEMIVSDVVKLAGPKKSETFAFDKPLKERIDTLLDNRLVTLRNFRERAIFKLQE